jgi:hypothetical protein
MVRVWLQPVTVTVTAAVTGVKGPGVAVFLISNELQSVTVGSVAEYVYGVVSQISTPLPVLPVTRGVTPVLLITSVGVIHRLDIIPVHVIGMVSIGVVTVAPGPVLILAVRMVEVSSEAVPV